MQNGLVGGKLYRIYMCSDLKKPLNYEKIYHLDFPCCNLNVIMQGGSRNMNTATEVKFFLLCFA